jgi:hypothetical protein
MPGDRLFTAVVCAWREDESLRSSDMFRHVRFEALRHWTRGDDSSGSMKQRGQVCFDGRSRVFGV